MSSEIARLVIIGGGNMGTALVGGLVASGWDATSIAVVEVDAAKRSALESQFGVRTSDVIMSADGALIAVKPGDFFNGHFSRTVNRCWSFSVDSGICSGIICGCGASDAEHACVSTRRRHRYLRK
jgi:pyrroline-5-carboxylate reductase